MQHERALVWDLPVRITHWLLVLGVSGSWITHYAGPAWFAWHRRCGYAVLVLVAFRIVWGFVGTRYARFAAFLSSPRAIADWLRAGARRTPGHNPLGALNVVALLLLLLIQGLSGLFSNDEISSAGPLYGWISHESSNRLSSLHRANKDWLLVLIGLHVAAVAWYALVRRQALVRAMISGRSDAAGLVAEDSIRDSQIGRAVLIVLALGAMLAILVRLAPQASVALF
jgi:cytochrome b